MLSATVLELKVDLPDEFEQGLLQIQELTLQLDEKEKEREKLIEAEVNKLQERTETLLKERETKLIEEANKKAEEQGRRKTQVEEVRASGSLAASSAVPPTS